MRNIGRLRKLSVDGRLAGTPTWKVSDIGPTAPFARLVRRWFLVMILLGPVAVARAGMSMPTFTDIARARLEEGEDPASTLLLAGPYPSYSGGAPWRFKIPRRA